MKRYGLFLFFLSVVSDLFSQAVEKQFEAWLSETPLHSFVKVETYHVKTGFLHLSLREAYRDALSIKKAYATWDSLQSVYERYDMVLSELLIYQLQRTSKRALGDLSITITSAIPVLFHVSIKVENGEVQTQVEYLSTRGDEIESFMTTNFFLPANVIPIDATIREARELVNESIMLFFKEEFEVDEGGIDYSKSGVVTERYQVDKKPIFTNQLNDRLVASITYIQVSNQRTELNLELEAYIARGIQKPGKYYKIDDPAFLVKISAIQINLANHLYLSSKQ